MDDLIAFIKARLDEDERYLNSNRRHLWTERPLREVAFKRAILRMHEPVPFWGNNPPPRSRQTAGNVKAWYCECQCPDGVIEGEYPCDTARILAAVWSDHDQYRQEWSPGA
jgi:hypothetical protein